MQQNELETQLAAELWGAGAVNWQWHVMTGGTVESPLSLGTGPLDNALWMSRVHPEDLSRVRSVVRDLLDGRVDQYEVEYRLRHVDGTWRWVLDRGRASERDMSGRAARMMGFLIDVTDRVHTQEALRKSEAVLRAVTENTPDWLFLIDETLCVRFLNRPFGKERAEELIGRSLLDVLPQPYRTRLEALYRRVLATGEAGRIDVRETQADGSLCHYEHRVVPVIDGGVVRSLTVAVTDVTERKRAETALQESRTTLQTVAASSADWLALFDLQRRCVFLNRPLRGLAPEGWIGAPVEDFAPPEDRAKVYDIFEHVMRTGEPRDFDQILSVPEQGLRYLELRVRAVQADGRIFGAVVNITDVTERHAQRDTLRTQARILETMREGVVLVDSASRIIRLTNPTFDKMFGYRAPELLGCSVEPLFNMPGSKRRQLESRLRENKESTAALAVEFECARRDGSRFVASCVFTPLTMGGVDHWLAVLNDVTERKRLEREIIEIANREQQRIGSDLHDGLGQDLTGIALLLRGVAAQLRTENSAARLDVEDVIGLVNNAIESTRSLARGLSPVSTGRGGLSAALQAFAARASDRFGIRVDFVGDLESPLRLSEAAATHLYRIAQEALTNIVRHSGAQRARIRLDVQGDELQLKIDDDGCGFKPRSADAAAGLGLEIMRYRAQMLGGDLMLETSTSGGASVRCICPLAAP